MIDQRPMDSAAPIRLAYVLLWIQVGLLALAAVPTVALTCWSLLQSGFAFGDERGGWLLFFVVTAAVLSVLLVAGIVLAALFPRGRNGVRWSIIVLEVVAVLPGAIGVFAIKGAGQALALLLDAGLPAVVIGLLLAPSARAYFNR